jgi:hypothetical protein
MSFGDKEGATAPFGDDFHAEVAEKLRALRPRATTALIVGSYAFRRPFIDDIDVAIFDDSIPPGEDHADAIHARGWTIDVALRNPAWMDPGRADRENVLYLLREMRKILAGVVLFDDAGLLEKTVPWWRRFEIPLEVVAPFYDRASRLDFGAIDPSARRLSLYYGVENLIIGWLHAEMRFRFSKPKWLLWDLAQLESAPFEELIRSMSAELCDAVDVRAAIEQLDACAPATVEEASRRVLGLCKKMLGDAKYMAERGEPHAAVWPLRMASFQLAMLKAPQLGLPYADIRAIGPVLAELGAVDPALHAALSAALLPDRPVPPRLLELFVAARGDFGRCLERRRAGASPAPPAV